MGLHQVEEPEGKDYIVFIFKAIFMVGDSGFPFTVLL